MTSSHWRDITFDQKANKNRITNSLDPLWIEPWIFLCVLFFHFFSFLSLFRFCFCWSSHNFLYDFRWLLSTLLFLLWWETSSLTRVWPVWPKSDKLNDDLSHHLRKRHPCGKTSVCPTITNKTIKHRRTIPWFSFIQLLWHWIPLRNLTSFSSLIPGQSQDKWWLMIQEVARLDVKQRKWHTDQEGLQDESFIILTTSLLFWSS